jgi:FkbM family methyltransferase
MSAFDGLRNTGRKKGGSAVTVPISTLDAEWREVGKPNVSLIKIDVEGAELGVLRGGSECIGQCKPAILLEWTKQTCAPSTAHQKLC